MVLRPFHTALYFNNWLALGPDFAFSNTTRVELNMHEPQQNQAKVPIKYMTRILKQPHEEWCLLKPKVTIS